MSNSAIRTSTSRPSTAAAPLGHKPRTLWGDAWRRFRRHRLALLGSVVLGFLVLTTSIGPFLWTTVPTQIDFANAYKGPTLDHPFGVDGSGRDMLARAMHGGRLSISVGIAAMIVAIGLGTLIGSISGFFGGVLDMLLMRTTDLFLSLPQLPLLLLLIYLFRDALRRVVGPEVGIFILIIAVIGGLNWMNTARVVRASFLSVKQKEFVEASRCLGASDVRIIVTHILPNCMSPIIIAATLSIGAAIILESTLSFLGLGFPPDFPTWGRMLNDARDYLDLAPHTILFPGFLIFLTVLSVNYMGDGLRDALDPRRVV